MNRIELPDAIVDLRGEEVRSRDGTSVRLRPRSFAVLRRLAGSAGEVVSKDDLLAECWPGVVVTEDSLTQSISEIRRALGESGRDLIRTVARRGYKLVPPKTPEPGATLSQGAHLGTRIAVLPFSVSPDGDGYTGEERNRLAAELTDDLTTELARNRNIAVLARDASSAASTRRVTPADLRREFGVSFIVEGGVRSAGFALAIDVRLIDARHSHHIWTERFGLPARDVSATRDKVAARIAATILSQIRLTSVAASLRRPLVGQSVQECVTRGLSLLARCLDRNDFLESRALFERAIDLDPACGLAHMCLGGNIALDAGSNITGKVGPGALPDAMATIRRGMELDPTHPYGHYALAVGLFLSGKHDEALAASERCIALAPGIARCNVLHGALLVSAGHFAGGLALIERAIETDRFGPSFYLSCQAEALYALDRFNEARRQAAEAAERSPGAWGRPYVIGAAVDIALGQQREATAKIATLLRVRPGSSMRTLYLANTFAPVPELRARYARHLRGRDAGVSWLGLRRTSGAPAHHTASTRSSTALKTRDGTRKRSSLS